MKKLKHIISKSLKTKRRAYRNIKVTWIRYRYHYKRHKSKGLTWLTESTRSNSFSLPWISRLRKPRKGSSISRNKHLRWNSKRWILSSKLKRRGSKWKRMRSRSDRLKDLWSQSKLKLIRLKSRGIRNGICWISISHKWHIWRTEMPAWATSTEYYAATTNISRLSTSPWRTMWHLCRLRWNNQSKTARPRIRYITIWYTNWKNKISPRRTTSCSSKSWRCRCKSKLISWKLLRISCQKYWKRIIISKHLSRARGNRRRIWSTGKSLYRLSTASFRNSSMPTFRSTGQWLIVCMRGIRSALLSSASPCHR